MHFSTFLKLFTKLILFSNYLQKMCGYPQFSFWISITLVKICFSCIFSKPWKNIFEGWKGEAGQAMADGKIQTELPTNHVT